eukprot:s978_g22.t1
MAGYGRLSRLSERKPGGRLSRLSERKPGEGAEGPAHRRPSSCLLQGKPHHVVPIPTPVVRTVPTMPLELLEPLDELKPGLRGDPVLSSEDPNAARYPVGPG